LQCHLKLQRHTLKKIEEDAGLYPRTKLEDVQNSIVNDPTVAAVKGLLVQNGFICTSHGCNFMTISLKLANKHCKEENHSVSTQQIQQLTRIPGLNSWWKVLSTSDEENTTNNDSINFNAIWSDVSVMYITLI
jgi:hypothetical protein